MHVLFEDILLPLSANITTAPLLKFNLRSPVSIIFMVLLTRRTSLVHTGPLRRKCIGNA